MSMRVLLLSCIFSLLMMSGEGNMSQATEQIASQYAAANVNKNTWSTVIYNVKAYGAKGDGVTDDTAAIQAVIDAAPAGSNIWFNGSFKVRQLDVISRTDLTFTGGGLLKGSANPADRAILNIDGSTRIKVKDLQISGLNSGTTDRGFWINNSSDVEISGNRITNFGADAFILWGGASFENANAIHDNYILGNNIGINLVSNAEYYHFYSNRIYDNNYGIYGALGNCRVDNNQINSNDVGVYLDSTLGSNPDHTSISGNQINHNRDIGLYIGNTVTGMQVIDNQILSTTGGAWPTTGKPHSLVLQNVNDIILMGNRIDADSSVSSWIYIDGMDNSRIMGNTFHGPVTEMSAGSNNAFIGNRYADSSTLNVHASTTGLLRYGELEAGVYMGLGSVVAKQTATLANSWANVAAFMPLSYWRDGEGAIHIQGTVGSGTANTNITTLPVNFRPTAIIDVACSATDSGTHGSVRIGPDGTVTQLSGGNVRLSINAVFKP